MFSIIKKNLERRKSIIVESRPISFRFGFNFSNFKVVFSVNSFDFRESKIKVMKYKRHIEFEIEEKPFVSEIGSKEKIDNKFSCWIRSSFFIGKRFSRFRSKEREVIDNIIKRKSSFKKLVMRIISFLYEKVDNISDSISMSVSNTSNLCFIESINKEKLTDMESSNDRISFHSRMIIK